MTAGRRARAGRQRTCAGGARDDRGTQGAGRASQALRGGGAMTPRRLRLTGRPSIPEAPER
jgi:hypothetical protein